MRVSRLRVINEAGHRGRRAIQALVSYQTHEAECRRIGLIEPSIQDSGRFDDRLGDYLGLGFESARPARPSGFRPKSWAKYLVRRLLAPIEKTVRAETRDHVLTLLSIIRDQQDRLSSLERRLSVQDRSFSDLR